MTKIPLTSINSAEENRSFKMKSKIKVQKMSITELITNI